MLEKLLQALWGRTRHLGRWPVSITAASHTSLLSFSLQCTQPSGLLECSFVLGKHEIDLGPDPSVGRRGYPCPGAVTEGQLAWPCTFLQPCMFPEGCVFSLICKYLLCSTCPSQCKRKQGQFEQEQMQADSRVFPRGTLQQHNKSPSTPGYAVVFHRSFSSFISPQLWDCFL